MKLISNNELKLSDIPEDNDVLSAIKFSQTCLDYLKAFDEISQISKKVKELIQQERANEVSLTELRISLFYYFRAIRHNQKDPNIELINKHLELIRNKIDE